jgi:hypothetical protein
MTNKADFTEQEWATVAMGPTSAGMIVITAHSGGSIRETFAMSKAYTEARKQHGESQLLDELVSTKPAVDHTHYHSPQELKENGLQHLRDAVGLLESKATSDELEDYRAFVMSLAERVANAHEEHGVRISDSERAAIDEIATALGREPEPTA